MMVLQKNEKVVVTLVMNAGVKEDIKPEEFGKDVFININVKANGIGIGGMVYNIDPSIKEPTGQGGKQTHDSSLTGFAGLDATVEDILPKGEFEGRKIKKITIKKINIDLEFEE
jgi:hypothetical protein